MTQVIFTDAYDFRPDGDWRSIVEYFPSEEPQTVTRECAKKAIKAGVAKAYKSKGKSNEKRKPSTKNKN